MLRLSLILIALEDCILRLASILYPSIASAQSGTFVILCFVIGLGSTVYLTLAVFVGVLMSQPLAWVLARDLSTK